MSDKNPWPNAFQEGRADDDLAKRKDETLESAKSFVSLWLDYRCIPAPDFRKKWGRDYEMRDLVSLAVTLREKIKEVL